MLKGERNAMSKDSKSRTLLIAFILAMFCSVLVSGAAILLRPIQNENRVNDRNKNVLIAAGMFDESKSIDEQFKAITATMIDLKKGKVTKGNVDTYFRDFKSLTSEVQTSYSIDSKLDIAGLRRVANKVPVYLVKKDNKIITYILPIYGQGLWSTLYGFLAVEADANTVRGLTFYEHAETPGLGGEVDNPLWKKKWIGKKLYDDKGSPAIMVIKGVVSKQDKDILFKIDGLSGATLTSRGVDNLVRFWIGENGFGSFLKKAKEGEIYE